MPSIEGGGVEKNLFIVSNYFSEKFENIYLITTSTEFKKNFDKKIRIISPKTNFWKKFGRRIKYFVIKNYITINRRNLDQYDLATLSGSD